MVPISDTTVFVSYHVLRLMIPNVDERLDLPRAPRCPTHLQKSISNCRKAGHVCNEYWAHTFYHPPLKIWYSDNRRDAEAGYGRHGFVHGGI